jgi:hypothetical protein
MTKNTLAEKDKEFLLKLTALCTEYDAKIYCTRNDDCTNVSISGDQHTIFIDTIKDNSATSESTTLTKISNGLRTMMAFANVTAAIKNFAGFSKETISDESKPVNIDFGRPVPLLNSEDIRAAIESAFPKSPWPSFVIGDKIKITNVGLKSSVIGTVFKLTPRMITLKDAVLRTHSVSDNPSSATETIIGLHLNVTLPIHFEGNVITKEL